MMFGKPTSWDEYVKGVGISGAPTISVKIDSGEWPKKHPEYVLSASVSATVGHEASTCQVVARCNESDVSSLSKAIVGSPIEVAIGRNGNNGTVFKGFISGVDFERSFVDGTSDVKIIINAMDVKMWMMVSKKTETKKPDTKLSQIATETLNSYKMNDKLTVKVNDEKKVGYIYQKNESDYDFLCRLANLVGALFYVAVGDINFILPGKSVGATFSISPGQGIVHAKMSANIYGLPSKITVMGVDEKDPSNPEKATLSGSAERPAVAIGSGKTFSKFIPSKVKDLTTIIIVDSTVEDVKKAESIAAAELTMRTLRLATLKLIVEGINCLEVGRKVKISGYGKPIDNTYILTGIEHNCNIKWKRFTSVLTLNANQYNPF